ncbi:hypothetical protein [Streptomyces orinoci]|uniref:Lipoprotein n=1 Tax=Streptomyces orinoci TaxID=67339 RepID=A0ABV3K8N9_STRON|nr:hypothetical protein [Streptomyces orinoci]
MHIRHARITTVAAAILTLSMSGCAGAATQHSAASQDLGTRPVAKAVSLPTGPRPQRHYTVQQQPAPGSCHVHYTRDKQPLPDPKCTPGALNPDVTPATLTSTICRPSGYTKGIRPPVYITGPEKAANAKSYGYNGSLHDAEYDHLVSLELGGDPNDPRNLWVEPPSPGHRPGSGANNPKDVVENKLHAAICSGQVQLRPAQVAIATDWTTALTRLGIR